MLNLTHKKRREIEKIEVRKVLHKVMNNAVYGKIIGSWRNQNQVKCHAKCLKII